MKLSVLLSIHNRLELFERGLHSYLSQTLDKSQFEVVVVDDLSTEDVRGVIEGYRDRINFRYLRLDHTRHPIWREMNSNGEMKKDPFENWYHTPALSTNCGIRAAKGEYLLITQPEVIQAPQNFALGIAAASKDRFAFGRIWMTTPGFSQWIRSVEHWRNLKYADYNSIPGAKSWHHKDGTFYWFIGFLKKSWAEKVCGVDEEYLRGVFAEDDNFRIRVQIAGCAPIDQIGIEGIHIDHSHEVDSHRVRTSRHWEEGSQRNRARYREFLARMGPVIANDGKVWGDLNCLVQDEVLY